MTRLDRAITLGVTEPLRHGLRSFRTLSRGKAAERRILPILMYHSISDDPEPGVTSYYRTVTSPARFAEQMQWLREHDYHGVALHEGLAWLDGKAQTGNLPPNSDLCAFRQPVALTFDDGFRDFYTAAFPILQACGFTATMYLPTSFIGDSRRQFRLSPLASKLPTTRECLTWSEVRELHSKKIEFGSHTVTHPTLTELAWTDIEREVTQSKSEIESALGINVSSFSYPYAFPQANLAFVERFKETLQAAGYQNCVTTAIGRITQTREPYRLNRLPINAADDRRLLRAKLLGAYDWLRWPQFMVQSAKAFVASRSQISHARTLDSHC